MPETRMTRDPLTLEEYGRLLEAEGKRQEAVGLIL